MGIIRFYNMFKAHSTLLRTRCLCEPLREKMFRFCSVFLASFFASLIKVLGFVSGYLYRSKTCVAVESGSSFSANHSQEKDHLVSKNSTIFWSSGLAGKVNLDLQRRERVSKDYNFADRDDTVCLQSGLVAHSSKYELMSSKDVCGYFEEPKTENFVVQEMFVESSEVVESSDQSVGCTPQEEESLENSLQGFGEESGSCSFCFKLLDPSCYSHDDIREHVSDSVGEEMADDASDFCCNEKQSSEAFGDEGKDLMEGGILEERDVSYEVELLPVGDFPFPESNQESGAAGDDISLELNIDQKLEPTETTFLEGYGSRNWMSSFLEEFDRIKPENLEVELNFDNAQRAVDLDDEFIELKPQSLSLSHIEERISCGDDYDFGGLEEPVIKEGPLLDGSPEQKSNWDSDSDDDDDDGPDVLWEHQNLVQQMKTELKNCRIGCLPTISEEECETPAMVGDLKPLEMDQKIEYKDIMEEIQKFYKSYVEKMRKLDILNYQTLHAISFQQLKVSEVFTVGTKRADSVTLSLPRIRPCKGQKIYADPMHRSIIEMHRDLELVYVGQLCLSWEILSWLYVKAQELSRHDSQGNHSYNRAAEEFQQFQVLVQRFIEDEPFQGQRIQNFVKSRCMIKCLLQVPTIRDDCLNTKKEQREEVDAVYLEMLTETIRKSMLIFQEFLFADKTSSSIATKGIQETGSYLQDPSHLMLLTDIITSLHKKDRKIKDHMRSQNCIVKKLKKHQECRPDHEVMTCLVELRLVSRVLNLSRLTTDQLVWCHNKLKNICFVGRKVHVEQSFMLFPC